MVDIHDYCEEKSCTYKNEEYLVRDNGAVLRKTPPQKQTRKLDNTWTFGKPNSKTGYLEIASVRIHRIVATAFLGQAPSKEHIVDHIDTNRQNNRPDNLRWLTKTEKVLLNEATRKKIEYRTGVSIFEFLKNPAAYRDCFGESDYSWMRPVNKHEAIACLNHISEWVQRESKMPTDKSDTKIGSWIYCIQDPYVK